MCELRVINIKSVVLSIYDSVRKFMEPLIYCQTNTCSTRLYNNNISNSKKD